MHLRPGDQSFARTPCRARCRVVKGRCRCRGAFAVVRVACGCRAARVLRVRL